MEQELPDNFYAQQPETPTQKQALPHQVSKSESLMEIQNEEANVQKSESQKVSKMESKKSSRVDREEKEQRKRLKKMEEDEQRRVIREEKQKKRQLLKEEKDKQMERKQMERNKLKEEKQVKRKLKEESIIAQKQEKERLKVERERKKKEKQDAMQEQKEEKERKKLQKKNNPQSKINKTATKNIDIDQTIPEGLLCPISQELMKQPVVATCGHTFEMKSITKWLQKQKKCPLCKQHLTESMLCKNYSLASVIQQYHRKK